MIMHKIMWNKEMCPLIYCLGYTHLQIPQKINISFLLYDTHNNDRFSLNNASKYLASGLPKHLEELQRMSINVTDTQRLLISNCNVNFTCNKVAGNRHYEAFNCDMCTYANLFFDSFTSCSLKKNCVPRSWYVHNCESCKVTDCNSHSFTNSI